mmetsp:Transcript_17296/g.47250  ORF Transcript_17296/g.47250 Transcript_17296/m.47250 type:complete len:313 (+) Transcript_17296:224-1162(+)
MNPIHTIAAFLALAISAQAFAPPSNPAHGSCAPTRPLQMIGGGGGGQWWNQHQNSTKGGSTLSSATAAKNKGNDKWMVENLESASKEMIQSYHNEVLVLKKTIAEMMEKIESGSLAVGDDKGLFESKKIDNIVDKASGDVVDSVDNVAKSVGKLEKSNQDSINSQVELMKTMDERLTDMQDYMETQTKLLLAQTRQRQIHFAMANVQKFSFSYTEHGRQKDSAALVEEVLWLFQKNFGLIIPEHAIYAESSSPMPGSSGFRGNNRGQPVQDETEEGKEAFRNKLLEQLEMLLGVKPTMESTADGQHILRLDF